MDCTTKNTKYTKKRIVRGSLEVRSSCPWWLRSSSGFTLIELLVALGLMAILMTMIATIFSQATQAFHMARASVEIHQNARATFNAMLRDLAAAEFTDYAAGRGHFAIEVDYDLTEPPDETEYALARGTATAGASTQLTDSTKAWPVNGLAGAYVALTDVTGTTDVQVRRILSNSGTVLTVTPAWYRIPVATDPYAIAFPSLTFTTLAPQPGARYAAPEAIQQLALVRYALEWDGGLATTREGVQRPTFWLTKRVRFPRTDAPSLDMNRFPPVNIDRNPLARQTWLYNNLWLEVDPYDPNYNPLGDRDYDQYGQPEMLAFNVLSMQVRVFVGVSGVAESGVLGLNSLTDNDGTASDGMLLGRTVEVTDLLGKEQTLGILGNTTDGAGATTLWAAEDWDGGPAALGWQYRIAPAWYELAEAPATLPWIELVQQVPAMVEVTLELTDRRSTRFSKFSERFYIHTSQR